MSRHGRRPHLNITAALTTFAGLDDLPGHLDGHGVITAPLLRAIAASWATLTTIAVNPDTGTATAIGALTYRPRQHLADQVITLAGTCRAAGCRQPAWRCDLDHLQPFNHQNPSAGGHTQLDNITPQCKFHHLLKHHTDWTPHLQPDLTIEWTTNTGHHATSHPRHFTLPNEWHHPNQQHPDQADRPDRTNQPGAPGTAEQSAPSHGTATTTPLNPDPGDTTARTAESDYQTGPAAPALAPPDEPTVIHGPTVTGPTIPVHPAGADHTEPNTELEDPDTIPDPGSIDIHPYRIQRNHTREHALRRIQRITTTCTPASQPCDVAAESHPRPRPDVERIKSTARETDPSPAALRTNITTNLTAIRGIRDRPDKPDRAGRSPDHNQQVADRRQLPDADLPDEPPF